MKLPQWCMWLTNEPPKWDDILISVCIIFIVWHVRIWLFRKVRSRLIGGCLSLSEDGSSERSLEEMSFGRLLRRASSKASDLLTFNVGTGGSRTVLDGEIIFSKNNVCVHPAEPVPGLPEHHPGTTHPLTEIHWRYSCYELLYSFKTFSLLLIFFLFYLK